MNEVLDPLKDGVMLLERYHRQYGKVPADLVLTIKSELARYQIGIVTTFYGWLLREKPTIAVFFCEDGDTEDDEHGPHERSLDDFLMAAHPLYGAM